MEIWKEVKGYEGYEVSSLGRVKSLARTVVYKDGRVYKYKSKVLKPRTGTNGYLIVNIVKDTKCKTRSIHQLLAEAFLNHTPDGYKLVVDHIDNNPLNNELGNLQVITARENTSKDRKGTSKYTGVCWHKNHKKWIAGIKINGKIKHLGYFTDELKAAEAYQNALAKLVK